MAGVVGALFRSELRVVLRSGRVSDFNELFGLDWALEANALFKQLIDRRDHPALIDYPALGSVRSAAMRICSGRPRRTASRARASPTCRAACQQAAHPRMRACSG